MEQRLIIGYTKGKLMHTAAKKKRGANSLGVVQEMIRPYCFSSLVKSVKRSKLEEKQNFVLG